MSELHVLEELYNIVKNHPLCPGDTISHRTAREMSTGSLKQETHLFEITSVEGDPVGSLSITVVNRDYQQAEFECEIHRESCCVKMQGSVSHVSRWLNDSKQPQQLNLKVHHFDAIPNRVAEYRIYLQISNLLYLSLQDLEMFDEIGLYTKRKIG